MKVYTVSVNNMEWDQPELFNFDTEEAASKAADAIREVIARLSTADEYDVSEIVGLPVLTADSIPEIIGDVSEWWG